MNCRDEGELLAVLYIFDSGNSLKALESWVGKKNPSIPSISSHFSSAEHYEREIHEQFGVFFEGNRRLRMKMFLPDDWPEGDYPMRKSRPNSCGGKKNA